MRKSRALWYSLIFVAVLVVGSAALLVFGNGPVLGLDLEGGVSVILQAPEGTPSDVMDQALENIRTRIDAFGTAEPLLYVTGNNIEVQIPGLARGTIQERQKLRYDLLDASGLTYGTFDQQADAQKELDAAKVGPVVQSVCLKGDLYGDQDGPCFGTKKDAQDAVDAMTVHKQSGGDTFCVSGSGLADEPCDFQTKADAQAAIDAVAQSTTQNYCVLGPGDQTLTSDNGAACYPTEQEAQDKLDELTLTKSTSQFCVISSADKSLGCFLTREDAEARLQQTGQERLLQVIGQTARLEFREVRQVLTPETSGYDTTQADCSTQTELESDACSFEALKDKDVVFFDRANQTKYKLGPVEMTGDQISSAQAVYRTATQSASTVGWVIDFTLTGSGSSTFGDITGRLAGNGALAIVVDRKVISAPSVNSKITGSGVIEGSFTKERAQDLATQLNAGALPVELTTQQVVTVSPTLGKESLDAGILAGVFGLILLALYLLFYYRILAIIAWLGMTIWAVLAFALVTLAGENLGYSLTLAGIAGLVISLGVTADSYIVFFERFKDEVHSGKTPRVAVQPAFKKAFRTIVAADTVTALAAIVLYMTAISSVRGFALTLGVATLLDLFVVYFFKRPAVFLLARNERLVTMRGIGVTSGVAADHEALPAIAGGSK